MTQVFLDSANLSEIEEISKWGIITGLTTNQKIFLNEKGCNFEDQAKKITRMMKPFPVSLEGPNNYDDLLKAALQYVEWGDNVIVKVPMLPNGDGLRAVVALSMVNIGTNVTACMTLNQTFLASRAGATYVSLFYNRMIDWMEKQKKPHDVAVRYALDTIQYTMEMLEREDSGTSLIVGSIRSPEDVNQIISVSPDIITIPTKILKQMPQNDMTDKTLKEFDDAWKEFCQAEKKSEAKT
jgi:transaldolase